MIVRHRRGVLLLAEPPALVVPARPPHPAVLFLSLMNQLVAPLSFFGSYYRQAGGGGVVVLVVGGACC